MFRGLFLFFVFVAVLTSGMSNCSGSKMVATEASAGESRTIKIPDREFDQVDSASFAQATGQA